MDKVTWWQFQNTSKEVIWPKNFLNYMHRLKSATFSRLSLNESRKKKTFLAKIRHAKSKKGQRQVTVSCLINHKKRIEAKLATAVNYATPITKGMQQGRNGYRVFNQDIQIQSTYVPTYQNMFAKDEPI